MGRTVSEGNVKVVFCPTVASAAAPTVANITAGTNLSPFITKDGIKTPDGQNMVDSATIEDTFDAQEVGSWGGAPLELTMYRDDTDDDAWELCVYGTRGFIVIGRNSPTGIAAADVVEVYPVAMHNPVMMSPAANEMQRFVEKFAVTSAPEMAAVVAA